MLRSYLLFADPAATTNAVATMQFPRNGTIKQVQFSGFLNTELDGDLTVQLAINKPTGAFTTTATPTDILGIASLSQRITTSGMSTPQVNSTWPLNQKVSLGDTLYVHSRANGTVDSEWFFVVWVDE